MFITNDIFDLTEIKIIYIIRFLNLSSVLFSLGIVINDYKNNRLDKINIGYSPVIMRYYFFYSFSPNRPFFDYTYS